MVKAIAGGAEFTSAAIDFSFCDITEISEVIGEDPREEKKLRRADCGPVPEDGGEQTAPQCGKYECTAIKLNNNRLTGFKGLTEFCREFVYNFDAIMWIDISFNKIKVISNELLSIPHLKILNLHGNEIEDFGQVERMSSCQELMKLSLYGNPIEKTQNYRIKVLATIQTLRELDFNKIIPSEMERVQLWAVRTGFNKPQKRK